MLEFLKLGYNVLTPYGDCERYDFVADVNNKFYKIQVKTANTSHLEEGFVLIHCESTTRSNGKLVHNKYSEDEIDFFATFYDGKCYLIPVNECSTMKRLRFTPPKNG